MDILLSTLADGIAPPSRLGILAWSEEHVRFPHSDRSERFDRKVAPWLIEPLEEVTDNSNVEVVCRAAVGSSKTTSFEVLIPYIISEDPGPTMVITQTDDDTKEWVETRLEGELKATKPVRRLWPSDQNKMKKALYSFPHMFIAFGGANLSSLQSKSIRWCLGDEVWQWKPGMLDEFRGRRHDRWNARMFLVSQGGVEGDDFDLAFAQTDQRVRSWICMACGHVMPYLFTQIKWDDKRVSEEEEAEYAWEELAKTVRLECEKCNHRHADTPHMRRHLSETAVYKSTNPNAKTGYVGFWWNALTVYWIPWHRLVWQWLQAIKVRKEGDEEPFWVFKQKRLAENRVENPEVDRTELKGSGYTKDQLAPGDRLEGEIYRFMTNDKQQDHFWTVIRIWFADGASRLIYEGKTLTFDVIRDVQLRYGVSDRLTTIDAQYDTPAVYRACAEYDWTAIHGSAERGFKHYSKKKGVKPVLRFVSKLERVNLGRRISARYFFFSADRIKDILVKLRNGEGVRWEIPDDASENYHKQIDSEVKKEVINKKTKKTEMRWVQVKKHNHMWDCEVHQVALAYLMGLLGSYLGLEGEEESE